MGKDKKVVNVANSKKKSSDHSKSAMIGGQKIDLNSEKAQYLHLTFDQIQELAMKQKSGELFSSEKHEEKINEVSICSVHSVQEKKSSIKRRNDVKKKVTTK